MIRHRPDAHTCDMRDVARWSIHRFSPTPRIVASAGSHVHASHHGQQTGRFAIEYGFDELNLRRICLEVLATNERAIRIRLIGGGRPDPAAPQPPSGRSGGGWRGPGLPVVDVPDVEREPICEVEGLASADLGQPRARLLTSLLRAMDRAPIELAEAPRQRHTRPQPVRCAICSLGSRPDPQSRAIPRSGAWAARRRPG